MIYHTWDGDICTVCGDKIWMESMCEGVKKYCNYPDCTCPFDMGEDNKCLMGYPQKDEA